MASSETVGEFLIKMGVDADGVDRKVNDVVNNIGNSINNFVTGVLAPAMAGLASLDFFKTMSDDIVQADRLSESLGMNIEKFFLNVKVYRKRLLKKNYVLKRIQLDITIYF